MHLKKKWIFALSCVMLACLICATAIGVSFKGVVDSSVGFNAPTSKLENITGQYDVSNLTTANFNDSVIKLDGAQTEISVIIDLGGRGLYDIYDKTESFSKFAVSSRATKYLKTLATQRESFISALNKSGIKYTYKGEYTSVSNAVAIRINSADFYKLGSIKGVKGVYRSEVYSIPETIDVVQNYTPVYSTGVYDSSDANQEGYDGDGMLVAVLDTGLDYTHSAFQIMPTGENQRQYRDIEAAFSSALEADSPLYSQSLGCDVSDVYINQKVPYAFDYADDDSDVYPSYSSHGTHVAGIIAGVDNDKEVDPTDPSKTFVGVAPNAQLAIMKVFTDNLESKRLGGADTVDILHAIDDCAKLGVDVINMSLGSAGGFSDEKSEDYVTQVYNNIQGLGISLIVAAGNEYSSGYGGGNGTNLASNPDSGTVGSPSSYEASLSVASIEGQKAPFIVGNEGTDDIVAFITNSSDGNGNEIDFIESLYKAVEAKKGTTLDRNEPLKLPYVVIGGVGNVSNYTPSIRRQLAAEPTIALIKRGDLSFADKVQYAKNNGAVACVIYNNLTGTIRMSLGELSDPIPACSIGLEPGTKLVSNAVGNKGTLTISKDYTAGPFMSDFSSWGPTPSLKFKPEITAYGGKIMSAIPGGYDQLSGTSMASPNMAGMVTLMRQYVKKNFGLEDVELNSRVYQMLMSTTTMVLNDEGNPYSPRKQGSGLGSLEAAMSTSAYITVPNQTKTKIELFDDPGRTGVYELKFTIHNITNEAISYVPNVYNMTETLAVNGRTVAEKAHMLTDTDVKVVVGTGGTYANGKVTISANASVDVTITLTLGSEGRAYLKNFENGMYVEGFVRFEQGSNSAGKICDISVPYLGFYGDWADAPLFDYTVFDISENENDSSVELEDKIHASAAATTPLGMYEDIYIIPLGSYVYTMEDTDVAINTSDDHAAISMFNNDYGPIRAINEFYGVYAGLLRGAKELDISVIDTVTGETVFEKTALNQRKSYAGGGSNVGSPVVLDIRPYDWDWNNNTEYELKLTGRLDWIRDGETELVSPDKNTFSFKFTVDYEAPTITDYRVRFEPYTEDKETKYRIYMDVDVFDNQYAMALIPCFLQEQPNGSNLLCSLTRYPLPIYSQKNDVTTVSFEITDYYEDYFKTGKLCLYPMDYAMNHSLYRVTPSIGVNYPTAVEFEEEEGKFTYRGTEVDRNNSDYEYPVYRLTLAPNELYKLKEKSILPEGAVNQKLTWTSSEKSVQAKDNEIFAGPDVVNNVSLLLKAQDRTLAKVVLYVRADSQSSPIAAPRLRSISFMPVFGGDKYVTTVGDYLSLKNNTETQLVPETNPWYYDGLDLTWSSDNEKVATVDENGLISTHATGTAYITAKDKNYTSVSKTVQVVVDSDYYVRNYRLYNYYGGEIVDIPSELNVMYLDEECFRDNTLIKKVILPDTLTEIPQGAFTGCTNLEEVEIPASCVAILNEAFKGCQKLSKITLKPFKNKVDEVETVGSLTIGISAFEGCTSLSEILYPERMTTIGNYAFYGCESLTSVNVSGLRVAGDYIFSDCTNLAEVIMSKQTRLGRYMFLGCNELRSVNISTPILPIGAFAGCEGLEEVTFDEGLELQVIGALAFYGCTSLEEIVLPNGEYYIGADAFSGCDNLSDVVLSPSTHILGDLYTPFSSCESFSSIRILDNAESNFYIADNNVLYSKDGKTLLLVPVLATFSISDIPTTVKNIGASAFTGNVHLSGTVDGLDRFDSVGEYAFASTGIVSVKIPAKWEYVPEGLCYECSKLENVDFAANSNVTVIGAEAFAGCGRLDTISIPESLTVIGEGAFMDCSRLKGNADGEMDLKNVTTVYSYAFANTKIEKLIASNTTTLKNYAFIAMDSLKEVELGAIAEMGEGVFLSVEYDFFTNDSSLVGNASIEKATFAEGTKEIGAFAFAAGSMQGKLTTVILPDNVKTIGSYAFYGRTELEEINLKGVKYVGGRAFMGCEGLTELDLSAVEEIGVAAFAHTTSLESADLSAAEEIGGSAFQNSGITELTINNVKFINAFAFAETKIETINIPASFNLYMDNQTLWQINDSGEYEEVIGKKAVTIMGGAFMSIDTLTGFTVDEGNDAFFAEDGVLYANVADGYVLVQYPSAKEDTEYVVKDGTVRIGDYAFYGNTALTKVTFPTSVKAIGAFAFYNDDTTGEIEREYVFEAVEAPILESVYAVTNSMVQNHDVVFSNYYGIFSTLYYTNFGHYAAYVIEEDHVKDQFQWLKDTGDTTEYSYSVPTYSYKITRPVNGIGYDTPVWNAYFSNRVTTSPYAADRTTMAAIKAIKSIIKADAIESTVNALSGDDAKRAKLNDISVNYLKPAREAYNAIVESEQQKLVTQYSELLAAELKVRELKAKLGIPVALERLERQGYYKTRYNEGDSFDPQDMRIFAIYEDGSLLELTSSDYVLDKTGGLKVGDKSITISFGGKSIELGIQVIGTAVTTTQYTVTFTGEGVTTSTQTVDSGSKAVQPAQPEREGYTFKYWYAQDESQAFDFDTPITSDITLTAAWEENGTDEPVKPVNVGLIVGLSVGGAVLAGGVAVLVVLLLRKKKLAQSAKTTEQVNEQDK